MLVIRHPFRQLVRALAAMMLQVVRQPIADMPVDRPVRLARVTPRRPPRMTHLCSDRVTHKKLRAFICKTQVLKALSSAPKAGRRVSFHEQTRVISRERAFFSCWTRKEAYIKAVGEGLSVPLNSFRVTLRPGEPTRFIHLAHDTTAARAWALHNLDPDHQYAAALAYQDAPRSIRVITLSEPTELLT